MPIAYIGIGSNLGDREGNVRRALDLIAERAGLITATSSLYETEPWGVTDQPQFINAACGVQTALAAEELHRTLRGIEDEIGRDRSVEKWGPRVIDIDILLYGALVLDTPELVIPHPRMHERVFVLAPMVEIAPETMHPALGIRMADLLGRLA